MSVIARSAPAETAEELYEQAPCGYLMMAPDSTITRANGTLARWLGVPVRDLVGRPFSALLSAGSRIYYDTHFAPLLAMQGALKEIALDLLRPGQEPLPVLVSATTARDAAGHPAFTSVSLSDMSDRRRFETELIAARRSAEEAQDRFQRLFDAAPDALVLIDQAGVALLANTEAERLFGRPRRGFAGKSLATFVTVDESHTPQSEGPLVRAALGQGPFEMTAQCADGRTVPVEARFSHIESAPGLQVIVNLRDITQRRAMERENRLALEQRGEVERLHELSRFKAKFVNTAAHELRTPLTPIRLQLAILAQRPGLGEEERHGFAAIERNVERLGTIVEDLLTVASSQAGTLVVKPRPMDMVALSAQALETFEAVAAKKSITATVVAGRPVPIIADPERLMQVMQSLLGNSFKFTPAGGRVEVRFEDLGDRVRVEVTDSGRGITAKDLALLFSPFVQVHEARDITEPGSGLGLYICRQLIDLHGGTIGLQSPGPGQGTTAWFVLPKAPPPDGSPG